MKAVGVVWYSGGSVIQEIGHDDRTGTRVCFPDMQDGLCRDRTQQEELGDIRRPPDHPKPNIYRLAGGDFDALVARLRTTAGSILRIMVCYEAGYDGFWLARRLTNSGIVCKVLDPASLQVNRRACRVKTDRIDALMLLRAVIAIDRGDHHVCAVVRVPEVEEEDARRSHRERQRLVRERTAHINRIKGLLFAQGIRGIEPKLRATRIDFGALVTAEGRPLPDRLRHELEREYAFAKLTRRRLKNGVFHSVVDLQAAINRFIKEHNQQPTPFVWRANPNEIIAAVRRRHQTLESIH